MSGLFGMLSTTARSLEAQRYGLDSAGQNIANINTPGYSRRVVDLGAVPPTSERLNAGNGVEVLGVRRLRDRFFDRRLFQENPAQHRETALAEALGVVEATLGAPEGSLNTRLNQFFDGFGALAQAPTSSSARAEVLARGQALAGEIRATDRRFQQAQLDADGRVRAAVDEVNSLANRLASLNDRIADADESGTMTLRDEQNEVIRELSSFLDIETIDLANGAVQISYGRGKPLVIGDVAYAVTVQNEPTTGFARLHSGVTDATTAISGGRIAGLIAARDVNIPGYRAELDTLAYEVVQQVNTLHDAGYTLGGVDAPPFFQPLGAAAAGAASQIALDPTVAANANLIAAGSVAATPGDNGAARGLAALRDARVLAGNSATFTGFYTDLVYGVGQDRSIAVSEGRIRGEVIQQIDNLRDSVSGVSLDEEAASMMRFQRAYEASARFFTTINQTLDVLLNLGR
jgi:flagellar hook-associated protein 1 FlgK